MLKSSNMYERFWQLNTELTVRVIVELILRFSVRWSHILRWHREILVVEMNCVFDENNRIQIHEFNMKPKIIQFIFIWFIHSRLISLQLCYTNHLMRKSWEISNILYLVLNIKSLPDWPCELIYIMYFYRQVYTCDGS